MINKIPAEQMNVGEDERVLSALGGGVLTLYGLGRGPAGWLLAGIGGWLVYRGLSGNCPLYSSLDINTAVPEASAPAEAPDDQSIVDTAVEDSFPASDPPSWTTGR